MSTTTKKEFIDRIAENTDIKQLVVKPIRNFPIFTHPRINALPILL